MLAGLEAFNRAVTRPREQLEPQLSVTPEMWRWRFGEVAVYKAGNEANPPLVLLHGHNAAASAAEMREPFARLSSRFYVYCPDLLGYGLSDRPDIEYTPRLYIELIEDLLREVVGRPAALLASSLTSAYAIEAAANNPEWVTALVLTCPTGVRRLTEQGAGGVLAGALLDLPVLGQAMYYGIASRPSIRYFLEAQTYADPSLVTDELVESYYRTAHAPGARHAPSAFVSGKLYWDCSDAWSRLEANTLIVWGRESSFTPPSDAAAFLALNPRAGLEIIERAGILPHDEQPEQFARVVEDWLERETASG
jgi:pimeloyl-ACP methyl ester carboxylesterase